MTFVNKCFLCVVMLLLGHDLIGQLDTLSGYVTDENGDPLSFVSIYQQNTSNATLSNDLGYYELILRGEEPVIYQYLGYKTLKETFSQRDKNHFHSVKLVQEKFELSTIEISANQEDPAYAIMRKAIGLRNENNRKNQEYQAELYVKGIVKLMDAPDKFLGQELGDLGGIVDSSRNGIIYLSETQSRVYKSKNQFKEELISSRVAGDAEGFGMNQFLESDINFYSQEIDLFRKMISPLDNQAFSYYKFKLESTFVDEGGNLIHRIFIQPKSKNRPCFSGELNIVDGNFQIHSLDLTTTGKALKSNSFKSFRISQVYSEIEKEDWRLLTQNIYFDASMFVFNAKGTFNSVYSKYDVHPRFDKSTFSNIQFTATEDAIKNDSAFWNEARPIALTEEEKLDYIKKDSLQRVWNSKEYLDSIDRKNNAFKLINLLSGYTYENSYKNRSFAITSPLLTTNFNAVEGLNISLKPSFAKTTNNRSLSIKGEVGYGFLDQKVKPIIESRYKYDKKKLASISFKIGSKITDYSNELPIMAEISNSWHSLIVKENYVKWYQSDILQFGWGQEVYNGLFFDLLGEVEHRSSLDNITNFSLRHKEERYGPNNPFELPEPFGRLDSRKASIKGEIKWKPGQKLMIYPNRTVRLESGLPTLKLNIEHAFPITSDYVSFSKIKIGIKDDYVGLRKVGFFEYHVIGGAFLKKGGSFPDAFHFIGHEVIPRYIHKYQSTYKLLPYYTLDNTLPFLSVFTQLHFDGFIMDKVPLLKNTGWKFVLSAASLIRDDIQYIEPGIGIEGIKIGPIDAMRFDYYWGVDQTGFRNKGIKFGFINFIDGDVAI